ncbi:MAG: hypothetical protein K2X86_08780 [Cytophagaceae bacterium]|nr:hypothetical protein [Cytophagaceae bacterium]
MRLVFGLFLCLCFFEIKAQTRVFVGVAYTGATFGAKPNLNLGWQGNSIFLGTENLDNTFGRYLHFDLMVERRLFGPYYWLSGVKFHQTGYRYDNGYYISRLKNSYLSVPLLLRINIYNGNVLYIDVGFLQNFLIYSDLSESYPGVSDRQNIAAYTSRLSTGFYFELTYAYRRFGLSAYFQSKSFATAKDFSIRWKLDTEDSLFLIFYRNYYFSSAGVKLNFRLR